MNALSNLKGQDGGMDASVLAVPRFSEQHRVDLNSGVVVAHVIRPSNDLPAEIALDLACSVARGLDARISLVLAGPIMALPGLMVGALTRAGICGDQIELAVNGAALEQVAVESVLTISALRDLGVDVALTGFGSPGTLDIIRHLPLSTVILPPSLIEDIPGNVDATTGLHTLLGLARQHAVRIVATGIECEAQRALLSGLGCEYGEGSLFGNAVLQQFHEH